MRDSFLKRGLARAKPELLAALAQDPETVGADSVPSDRSPF
jgi:hypothetical protein